MNKYMFKAFNLWCNHRFAHTNVPVREALAKFDSEAKDLGLTREDYLGYCYLWYTL